MEMGFVFVSWFNQMKGKHVLKFTERKYTYFVMILAGV